MNDYVNYPLDDGRLEREDAPRDSCMDRIYILKGGETAVMEVPDDAEDDSV